MLLPVVVGVMREGSSRDVKRPLRVTLQVHPAPSTMDIHALISGFFTCPCFFTCPSMYIYPRRDPQSKMMFNYNVIVGTVSVWCALEVVVSGRAGHICQADYYYGRFKICYRWTMLIMSAIAPARFNGQLLGQCIVAAGVDEGEIQREEKQV